MSNEKTTCGRCNGSGQIICPGCGGSGTTRRIDESSKEKIAKIISCAGCNGRGTRTCGSCNGSGQK